MCPGARKGLSQCGAVRLESIRAIDPVAADVFWESHTYDAMNWYYACILRMVASQKRFWFSDDWMYASWA
eukprot:5694861-Karenia_brevis.AAC.1